MSVSIHMNGRTRGEVKQGIVLHQIRTDEEQGKKAKEHTDTGIRPELTRYNKVLYHESNLLDTIRHECDTISRTRQEQGKRKLRTDANVMMVGTIQLSDDTLQALGWRFDGDQKLPTDRQTPQTLKNVETAYKRITESVKAQPERYGKVRSATLHMDEGSPHVDLIADPLDVTKPDQTARHFLNGEKGTPKGQRMREMQDHLLDYARFTQKDIDRFGLTRGDSRSKRVDGAKMTRKAHKQLNARETAVKAREEAVSKREMGVQMQAVKNRQDSTRLDTLRQELDQERERLKAEKAEIAEKAEKLRLVNSMIDRKKADFPALIQDIKTACNDLSRRMGQGRETLKKSLERAEIVTDKADDWLSAVENLSNLDEQTKSKGRSL